MAMGRKVMALNVLRADDILGVNTRQHLAQAATRSCRRRIQDHWMTEGVTIVDPAQHLHRRPGHDRPRHGDLTRSR